MTQLQAKLGKTEHQLTDENIYKEDQKAGLNDCLAVQIDLKQRLSNCEEQWLEYQEQLEQVNG